jgi:hypothetical protein
MTELVVITAASSVLGTLTFGYFVWLGLGLRKALKRTEESLGGIARLDKAVDSEFARAWRNMENESNEVNLRINDVIDRMNRQTDGMVEAQRNDVNSLLIEIDNVRKEIDRRFDRVYLKLYTEFPQLKDAEQVTNN